MSLQKKCADHLRAMYSDLPRGKLRSGHAHEIVAAFFGYRSAAALQVETRYPLSNFGNAKVLIPDIPLIEKRLKTLNGLPDGLVGPHDVASLLSWYLKDQGHFAGDVWEADGLRDEIDVYLQNNILQIEDDLSGEMAETNAYFDELDVDEVEIESGDDVLVATASGFFNGESDPDRAFSGDKIAFTTRLAFPRVAGRIGYGEPEMETSGAVDDSDYYDVE